MKAAVSVALADQMLFQKIFFSPCKEHWNGMQILKFGLC